jgi:hypothetical protein
MVSKPGSHRDKIDAADDASLFRTHADRRFAGRTRHPAMFGWLLRPPQGGSNALQKTITQTS